MTKVINLFGGSGLGKSTTAALIFGEMKLQGLHCELVREFVKEWAWAGRKINPGDQTTILENQAAREALYYNKLDYIITDSPLLLGPIYEKYYSGADPIAEKAFAALESAREKGIIHMNFVLKRNKPFDARGRYETAQQASEVDTLVEKYLVEHSVPFHTITADDHERVQEIIKIVLQSSAQ